MINWEKEVKKIQEDLIKDTQSLLRIKSVLDEESSSEGAPFGQGIKEALEFTLAKCKEFNMDVKNLEGYAGYAEIGQGSETLGILCHLDVVPEGNGWTYPPYEATIKDGKIFARGAIDDKSPSMAIIYALKIIRDLNIKLNKKVRVIFGTDEESEWRGIKYYLEREEMPTMGFAPDADFPIIISEKGIATITLEGKLQQNNVSKDKAQVSIFTAGQRPNMVPDFATAKITAEKDILDLIKIAFNTFLINYELGGEIEDINESELIVKLRGVSAHGMEPQNGVNAGLELINFFIASESLIKIDSWMKWSVQFLYHDYFGNNFEIDYEDETSGFLTVNPGMIHLDNNKISIVLNIRYPITTPYAETIEKIKVKASPAALVISQNNNAKPHNVDKNHFLVETLKRVYKQQTGTEAELLSIGGGTYARALNVGVAFGPNFPGKPETAHQKDEFIEIDDLLKATAIYTQAIYELAK
ncbi:MAG: dipeptidase PepV [Vulcanibacillus sp.]